ncbi:MAG: DJ-1/PfpI family protein [Acidobacteriota bacterium]|nr:DJ-1/PfpI family protein [Acidobacteriota bacterium]
MQKKVRPKVAESKALSLFARPGTVGIQARRIAILVADGVNGSEARTIAERLTLDGAVPVFVAPKLGTVQSAAGKALQADASLEVSPSVVFDAVVVADGDAAVDALAKDARAVDFLKEQYRHCKPILVLGAATRLLQEAGIHRALPSGKPDSGLIVGAPGKAVSVADAFIAAVAAHRHYDRESDPPAV